MLISNVSLPSHFAEVYDSPEKFISEVNAHLRSLITEKPDFQYCSGRCGCHYNSGPSGDDHYPKHHCTGCVFGQAFQRMGVPADNMAEWGSMSDYDFEYLTEQGYIPSYWVDIQETQDEGKKWGRLLRLLPKE